MSNKRPLNDCPDSEALSSWLDGESGGQEQPLRNHLSGCETCAGTVDAYRRVDHTVRTALPAVSDDLTDRIKDQCRSLPRVQPARTMPFQSFLWKAAAVLALVLAASALYRTAPGEGENKRAAQAGNSDTRNAPQGAVATATGESLLQLPMSLNLDRPLPTVGARSGFGNPHLQTVSNGGELNFRMGNPNAVSTVPKSVRHVWVLSEDDWGEAQKFLDKHFSQGQWIGDNEQAEFQVELSDTALQALVDGVNEFGPGLVSPTFPQPNKASMTAFTGRDVQYRMVFIVQE